MKHVLTELGRQYHGLHRTASYACSVARVESAVAEKNGQSPQKFKKLHRRWLSVRLACKLMRVDRISWRLRSKER